jgi:hypothetical protein
MAERWLPFASLIPKAAAKDDKEQSKLFIEKAREIGSDEESSAADDLMQRLTKMPPQPHAKTRGQGRK